MSSVRPPALFATCAVAALAAVGVGSSAAAKPPSCLGEPATIVGHGTIHGTAHADVIVGGAGVDHIYGGRGDDRICAGAGNDVLEGGEGSDRIEAGPGDDDVIGGNGSDEVRGGLGDDTIFGKRGNDRLDGDAGTDYLESGLGDDTVDGGPGNGDQVIGGVGNDHLDGGPGDGDVLEGDHGTDAIDGGPGAHDTASYAIDGGTTPGVDAGVKIDLAGGTAEGDGDDDSLRGIEDVVGSAFADTIVGDAGPNQLFGGGGIDELIGGGGEDQDFGGSGLDRCLEATVAESCELGDGHLNALGEAIDRLYGEPGAFRPELEVDLAGRSGTLTAVVEWGIHLQDGPGVQMHVSFVEGAWIVAAQGVPIVTGEGCAPVGPEVARCPLATTPTGLLLEGSAGADAIVVEPSVPATASATIVGGLGVDELVGGAGDDSLDADAAFLASGTPGDVVRGGAGDDALTGGSTMAGEGGSDLLIAQPCGETIDGGPGIDSVSFARVAQGVEATLGGTAGPAPGPRPVGGCPSGLGPTNISRAVETIEGSPYDDVLSGDPGPNMLLGRGGDDVIHGGGGDDFLVGGQGRDAIYGEAGLDRLYAADGDRDKVIDCGSTARGDVAFTDPAADPPARCFARPDR